MKWLAWALTFSLTAPGSLLAQQPGRPPGGPGRPELQAQVLNRFVDVAAQNLGLQDTQRDRLAAVVRETMDQRRRLATESMQLQTQLAAALQSDKTEDKEFSRLVSRLDDLREQEMKLWREENSQLSRFLTPRQHAQFLALRQRFNDRVMRMRRR